MKETTPLSVYLQLKPQGVYIGIRGKGGRGANPGPKYGCGLAITAAGSSRAARCRVCPLVLTNQLSKVNGYIIGL